ncbi:hypothetical protein C1J00_26590 [Streptomyces cahuitamycinicus]|uniref:Uncharacterized protein n=1 Tax=Streptomyces cahuitamycinicus TaxID=2070367 RepID=A0A2N8TJR6_9ACTN|nr:hypothetical protein C1J00_26590 [Streptomyces cahuitamycinicus]
MRQVFRVDLPSLLQQLADDLRDVQGVVPRSPLPSEVLDHSQVVYSQRLDIPREPRQPLRSPVAVVQGL